MSIIINRRSLSLKGVNARQKLWDSPIVAADSVSLQITAPNQVAIARLTVVSAPYAGAFLHAVPITFCGTRLDERSLRIAITLLSELPFALSIAASAVQ